MSLTKYCTFALLCAALACKPNLSPLEPQSEVASLKTKTGQTLGTHTKDGKAEPVCIHKFVYPHYQISTPKGLECGLNRRLALSGEVDYPSTAFEPWLKEIGSQSMIKRDMRYATNQIFPLTPAGYRINEPLYGKGRCFLQPRAISSLNRAADLLIKHDPSMRLMVYDCYRPMYVSQIMWDKVRDPVWVAASGKSGHNVGGTVDLTLATLVDGQVKEVDMGSPFDLFERISSYIPNLLDTSSSAYKNRTLLRKIMIESGMNPYDAEWWHFSLPKDKLENTEHLDLPL